jgi:hypothetical protein
MTDTTNNAQTLRTLAGKCYFSGRATMNGARDVERACETIVSQFGNPVMKQAEADALPERVAHLVRHIEEQAERLPALRAIANGQALPTKVESLGSSVVVRYKAPTNSRGAGWIATMWRDNETTFRASSSFTYEDKDNDGADIAASKCLAKFTAYCNSPEFDLPQVTHRLTGRASLGNGSYAYTFTATR